MDVKPWSSINPISLKNLLPMTIVSGAISVLMLVVPLFSLQVFDRVLSSQSLDTITITSCRYCRFPPHDSSSA